MQALTLNQLVKNRTTWRAAFYAGLVAGMLDGLAACLLIYFRNGRGPAVVFKFIASGVFGTKAFAGGYAVVASGIFFHFLIATIWALPFFFIYPFLKTKSWIVAGIAYGIIVWLLMNLVVVPLSRTPNLTPTLSGALIGASVLVICVGLPIAYLAQRHYKNL